MVGLQKENLSDTGRNCVQVLGILASELGLRSTDTSRYKHVSMYCLVWLRKTQSINFRWIGLSLMICWNMIQGIPGCRHSQLKHPEISPSLLHLLAPCQNWMFTEFVDTESSLKSWRKRFSLRALSECAQQQGPGGLLKQYFCCGDDASLGFCCKRAAILQDILLE